MPKTLEIKIRDKSIADALAMTIDAFEFFADDEPIRRSLGVIREDGLGYIRLGQSATELSGGEAQRVNFATELQRSRRSETLYVLDEPTTGLHLSDVAKLMKQLDGFIEADNSVIVVEHNMSRRRGKRLDHRHWAGVGDEGGRIVVLGPPQKVARIVEPDIQVPCRSPAWRRGVSATDVPRRSDVPKVKLQRGR